MADNEGRARVYDISYLSYQATLMLQQAFNERTSRQKGSTWLTLPEQQVVRVIGPGDEVALTVKVSITSEKGSEGLSWSAVRAYTYALHTGLVERLKARSTRTREGKTVPYGTQVMVAATITDSIIMVLDARVETVSEMTKLEVEA